jgi:hypothetical protein
VFLTAYEFTGPRETLLEGWHRMFGHYGTDLDLHVVVVTETGLTILDACPDRATMERFSTSEEFLAALAASDLPRPVVRPLGDVHVALARDGLVPAPARS